MQNKDIIIIALAILVIYLYLKCHGYLDDYKAHLDSDLKDLNENKEIFQELRNQVNHYQTLYQKRVERDLGLEKKVSDLETALLNLAKQKLKGKKEAQELLTNLETNWKEAKENWQKEKQIQTKNLEILQKLQNFHHLVAKSSGPSLDREQVNQAEALVEQITQPELKQLASWMVTDSAFVLGHNNLLTKLANQENKTEQLREQHQDNLRKINIIFDDQAQDYQFIDFNGLYSLLKGIAERERERESKSKWWKRN